MAINKTPIFIDTSAFKAVVDPKDEFHTKGAELWENLKNSNRPLVTTNYILDESFTLIRARCGIKTAIQFKEILAASSQVLQIKRVTVADEAGAWNWFTKEWAKLSFTDSVSFAVMERLKLSEVATFDNDFKRAGFRLVGHSK